MGYINFFKFSLYFEIILLFQQLVHLFNLCFFICSRNNRVLDGTVCYEQSKIPFFEINKSLGGWTCRHGFYCSSQAAASFPALVPSYYSSYVHLARLQGPHSFWYSFLFYFLLFLYRKMVHLDELWCSRSYVLVLRSQCSETPSAETSRHACYNFANFSNDHGSCYRN